MSRTKNKYADQIHPALEDLAVPVDGIDELPGNPRLGDTEAVARSYEEFGQEKPIVLWDSPDGRRFVIAGNTQLRAARDIRGWTEIAGVVFEGTETEAKAFALADNHTADLGRYDQQALIRMLREVSGEAELLAAASYSEDDILELLEPGRAPDGFTEYDDDVETDYTCPRCGYEWSGKPS